MNKLKEMYAEYLDKWRVDLEQFRMHYGTWSFEDIKTLHMQAHQMAGTGATYGFADVTDAARQLEQRLFAASSEFEADIMSPNTDPDILNDLERLIHVCQAACTMNNKVHS